MKRFFDHVIIGSMIEVLSLGILWGQTIFTSNYHRSHDNFS